MFSLRRGLNEWEYKSGAVIRRKSRAGSHWKPLSWCWICWSFTSEQLICHRWFLLRCLYCNDFSVHLGIDFFYWTQVPLECFCFAVTKSFSRFVSKLKQNPRIRLRYPTRQIDQRIMFGSSLKKNWVIRMLQLLTACKVFSREMSFVRERM